MIFLAPIVILMLTSPTQTWSQETWVRTFGGSGNEYKSSLVLTSDGGCVLAGTTLSKDGDFDGMNTGGHDAFVIKLDSRGGVRWKRTFGGDGDDISSSITLANDGGYVVVGKTQSNNGNFDGMMKGGEDAFVVRLDSLGDVEWVRTFGGSGYDGGWSIATTHDNEHVLTGFTSSNDGDFEGLNKGGIDMFVIRLDEQGGIRWRKTFGGSSYDSGFGIVSSLDSGCVLTGFTSSNDGDFAGVNRGGQEVVVIKLGSGGDVQWEKTYGGSDGEESYSITPTHDRGYIMTGFTRSNNGNFDGVNRGGEDAFVVKLDSLGDVQWVRTFGGSDNDVGWSIATTPDDEYVLTGFTSSIDGDFEGLNKGGVDIFVVRLDEQGGFRWRKTFGGSDFDEGRSIGVTRRGFTTVTGVTRSVDKDFKGIDRGGLDIFVIKLDSNGHFNLPTSINEYSDITSSLSVSPNPLSPLSTISYSLDKPSHVRIEVVNSVGEVVSVLSDEQEEVGSHQFPFNTTHLVTGTYTVRLFDNEKNRVLSKRVIHIR